MFARFSYLLIYFMNYQSLTNSIILEFRIARFANSLVILIQISPKPTLGANNQRAISEMTWGWISTPYWLASCLYRLQRLTNRNTAHILRRFSHCKAAASDEINSGSSNCCWWGTYSPQREWRHLIGIVRWISRHANQNHRYRYFPVDPCRYYPSDWMNVVNLS